MLLIFELNSQSNYTPPLVLVLRQHNDWLELFTEPTLCTNTIVSAHIQNRQLEDSEEQFAEFDQKCFGLESWSAPLQEVQNGNCLNTSPSHYSHFIIQKGFLLKVWSLMLAKDYS